MNSYHKTFRMFLFVYASFVVSCEEEKKVTAADEEVDPCAYEEQFSSIQALIDAASAGDTILVDPGTYEGSINFQGKDVIVGSLFLSTGDSSYISQTILDAKQKGSVVRFENNETSAASLVGFTVTGGYAVEGGGIYVNGAEPTLRDLRVLENAVYICEVGDFIKEASGGGIFINGSSPILERITVRDNSSEADGGGVYLSNSDANLTLVTIFQNTAANLGGGLFTNYSTSKVLHVEIAQNTAAKGAGVYAKSFSELSFENSNVGDNTADSEGGGFYLTGSKVSLLNVVVASNTSSGQGGSYFLGGGTVELMNVISIYGSPQEVYASSSGNLFKASFSLVAGVQEGIEMNNAGDVDWREGNIDDDESEIFADAGNYCIREVDWEYLGIFEKALPADKGNPLSTYNDIPWGPERWCSWGNNAADDPPENGFFETNTERNDMGGYGGPNGGWRRNPR